MNHELKPANPPINPVIIYHNADFDGMACRAVAYKKFGEAAIYIGWNHGDPVPTISASVSHIYLMDLSIPSLMDDPRLTWIDHHISAIKEWGERNGDDYLKPIRGYRIDGVAACRLAWQYFFEVPDDLLPAKQAYVDRKVKEPWAIRLCGEHDVFDHRDANAWPFQYGLRALPIIDWPVMLNNCENDYTMDRISEDLAYIEVEHVLTLGRPVKSYSDGETANTIKNFGFDFSWEGLVFLGCNSNRFSSSLFEARINPKVHDAMFNFCWTGTTWRCSMYGLPSKPEINLVAIAQKYGGGGHKGACGFTIDHLPFLPNKADELADAYTKLGEAYKELSGRGNTHFSDCPVNNAPALCPAPCDCNE